ncbi:uroporphyrinogen-III synthase [compost metagenome]
MEELPAQFRQEGLFEQLEGELVQGQRALLVRGDLAREWLPRELRSRGVDAVELDVYETVLAKHQDDLVLELLQEGSVHVVTFTSSSTVTNLLEVLRRSGIEQPEQLLAGTQIASIGPITTATAKEAGLSVSIEPEEATIEALVAAIASHRLAQRPKG